MGSQAQKVCIGLSNLLVSHLFFRTFVGSVTGRSMQPTLNNKDWVIFSPFFKPKRGDIIIGKKILPDQPASIVKRIIGVEGDVIITRDNELVFIPPGHCWLEGDNGALSRDSNVYGIYPLSLVKSKVLYSLFPPRSLPPREIPLDRFAYSTSPEIQSKLSNCFTQPGTYPQQ